MGNYVCANGHGTETGNAFCTTCGERILSAPQTVTAVRETRAVRNNSIKKPVIFVLSAVASLAIGITAGIQLHIGQNFSSAGENKEILVETDELPALLANTYDAPFSE